MCVVIGKKGDDYIVNDPYGDLNDGYSSDVYNGKGAVYKKSELKVRWCPGGNDGWGRIFDQPLPKEQAVAVPLLLPLLFLLGLLAVLILLLMMYPPAV